MPASGNERQRPPRWRRAAVLLPVALLVAAWTASLGSAETTSANGATTDPGIPSVPTTRFDDPASYTTPPSLDPDAYVTRPDQSSTEPGTTGADPSTESANGIPQAALTAYQRSEAVLEQADSVCNVPWELIAAIGRVESDHGRYGGNILDDEGKSTPGIYGIPLDGTNGTALITDTDGGRYDRDTVYDRAVGSMQFIPSTWEIVGVDGDADSIRDPQDIDDAALAAGVYLCAGDGDLSTTEGQRTAVFSYNHSDSYVDLVLSIMAAYFDGDFTAIDNGLPSNDLVIDPDTSVTPATHHHKPRHQPRDNGPSHHNPDGNDPSPGDPNPDDPIPGDPNPGDPNPGPGDNGGDITNVPPPPVDDPVDPVVVATAKCRTAFADAGIDPSGAQMQACIAAYQAGGAAAVNNLMHDILDALAVPDPPDLPIPDIPHLP